MDDIERACAAKMMLAFLGTEPDPALLAQLRARPVSGVTLFHALNIADPAQVRALAAALQATAAQAGEPPLLVATDQEGGQLMAVATATPFPGNMALGAAGSDELARQAGAAVGRELAAMGINANYAPVCDVHSQPRNPVVGTRSFGQDPALVARLAAAMIEGLQSAGVAATAKHFPGHGGTEADSHHGLPILHSSRDDLDRVDLPPFAAAIQAGVRLVMTAHVAVPGLTGGLAVPATLARPIMTGLLREEMGFQGVVITDALNMAALDQGPALMLDAVAAAAAGVDLLLSVGHEKTIYEALLHATRRGLLAPAEVLASAERVRALRKSLAGWPQPPLEVVGCADHRRLAAEIALRSITLVRDAAALLPLRPAAGARWLVVTPRPANLTPADTSSGVACTLAAALRLHHAAVDEVIVPHAPAAADVAGVTFKARDYDLVIAGSINAFEQPGQAALVNALLASGVPTLAVALRLPHDLQAYPGAPTYVCTYGILEPSMTALAAALLGRAPFRGKLPAAIGGYYPLGHGVAAGVAGQVTADA